ncbi:MAG: hypothetical protein AAF226_16510, partial [Verrucomicrobiota bacterium]
EVDACLGESITDHVKAFDKDLRAFSTETKNSLSELETNSVARSDFADVFRSAAEVILDGAKS